MKGALMQPSLSQRIKEWRNAAPLFLWRKAQGLTRADIAAMLGVSATTLQNWEMGQSQPNDAHMQHLVELTQDPKLPQKWRQWLQNKPKP